jgi:hypothetical protein
VPNSIGLSAPSIKVKTVSYWIIIPVFGIVFSGKRGFFWKIPALSPFVYVLLGVFFGWWLWGWIIIPITSILIPSSIRKRKRRKRRRY